jgi:hypothetical protein
MDTKKVVGAAVLALPLIVGGLVYANGQKSIQDKPRQTNESGYVCPVTGEELPCKNCCPLSQS